MDDIVNLFALLSDKTRLRILMLLMDHELCVCEIFAALNMSQPRVSRQLAMLKQSRIIKDRRDGKWIYYRIGDNEYAGALMSILNLVSGWTHEDSDMKNDKAMLGKISELKKMANCCSFNFNGGGKVGE